ncbi:MAG: GntR family transcriptional regulator [Acidobacteria bacterium]|nr:GntR family transcriptional regulator [Acidobacteriota bacterium]
MTEMEARVLIVVDPNSGVPVYRQLMDQIRFYIASGLLKPGDELPSTRVLSSELGVNPMTISKAYNILERDEIIERRPGRPLVVRALDGGQVRERRLEQLRGSLGSAARVARQLGISRDDALRVFGGMLGMSKGGSDAPPQDGGGGEQ